MITTNYRKDIDGLRAVAVLMTVFFHADYALFSGGFIGVNVFFVISGYVVTLMLLKNMESQKFSLVEFYARRAKRLAPALYLMLATAFITGLIFLPSYLMQEIALSTKYVAIFWANVFFAGKTTYFDGWAEMKPLLHTWSLSVEEQFYLLLPILLYWSVGKGFNLKRAIWILTGLGVASFLYSEYTIWYIQNNPGVFNKITRSSFYFLTSRAFEFIIGSLIALFVFSKNEKLIRLAAWAKPVAIPVGLLGLLLCSAIWTKTTRFPGALALIPDLLSALVLLAGAYKMDYAWVLENRLAVFFGKISYCLYLWHWFVFFVIRYFTGGLDKVSSVIGILISIALASITHYKIESRLRYSAMPSNRSLVLFIILPMLTAVSLSKLSGNTNGFDFRLSAAEKALEQTQTETVYNQPNAAVCHNNEGLSPEVCRLGDESLPINAVLWGDSHAYHMIQFVDRLGKDFGYNIKSLTHNGCMPALGDSGQLLYWQKPCIKFNSEALSYILSNDSIRLVILGYLQAGEGHAHVFEEVVSKLNETGKKILIFNDIAAISEKLLGCQNKKLRLPSALVEKEDCGFDKSQYMERRKESDAVLRELERKYSNVRIVQVEDLFCDGERCYTGVDGKPVYMKLDTNHLNLYGSEIIYDLYRAKRPNQLENFLGKPKAESGIIKHQLGG